MAEEPVNEREELIERIAVRLAELDDESLRELDVRTEEAVTGVRRIASPVILTPLPEPISRRELLVGLVAGGAALAGSSLAAGVWAGNRGVAVGRAAARAEAALEATRLRELLSLYEELEDVGLDAIVSAAMSAVGGALRGLSGGVELLRGGIQAVDQALTRFEELAPLIRSGLAEVEDIVRAIAQRLEALRARISDILGEAQPLAQGLGRVFSVVLDNLPFGIGDQIRDVVNQVQELLGRMQEMIAGFYTRLFQPLWADWFPKEEDAGIEVSLFSPVRRQLLGPLDEFLGDVIQALDRWETEMVGPVQAALDQRQAIRQEISRYRREHGLA